MHFRAATRCGIEVCHEKSGLMPPSCDLSIIINRSEIDWLEVTFGDRESFLSLAFVRTELQELAQGESGTNG